MADSARSRVLVLVVSSMVMFIVAFTGQIHPAVLGLISKQFALDVARRGLLLGIGPIGFLIATLATGWLSDRWGRRPFIWLGIALACLGTLLAGFARNYPQLQAGIFLIGLSAGSLESPGCVICADAFPDRRAQMLNLTQMFFCAGAIIGPAVVAALLWLGWGWRAGFVVGGCLAFAALCVSVWGLSGREERAAKEESETPADPIPWLLVGVLGLALFLYVGGEMTFALWSSDFIYKTFAVSKEKASMVLAGFWLGVMIGRLAYWFMVRSLGLLLPLLLSSICAVAAGMVMLFSPSALVAASACILVGISLGGTWPTILAYAGRRIPQRAGTVFGVIVAMGSMGMIVFPPLGGYLAERLDYGHRPVIAVAIAAIVLEGLVVFGLWVCNRARHRHPRPNEATG